MAVLDGRIEKRIWERAPDSHKQLLSCIQSLLFGERHETA
jgi:hypothetical protein